MKNRISFFLLFAVLFTVSVVSCSDSKSSEQNSIIISSWNVQNIFDAVDDGTEYSEYTSDQGWNNTYYKARLKSFSEVLSYDFFCDSSVIVLNEVENENVVKDILNQDRVKKKGFRYYACGSEENGAISICVISRFPIKSAKIHSFTDSRPIVQIELVVNGKQIHILAIHAKSNLGEEEFNKQSRLELAQWLEKISEDLLERNPSCGVVIAGDFNENPTDKNMMSDSRTASSLFSESPLKVSDSSRNSWYCMWLDKSQFLNAKGSCYFVGDWQQYDNILVKNMEILRSNVVFYGILKNSSGTPARWERSILSGVSDHLPISVEVLL